MSTMPGWLLRSLVAFLLCAMTHVTTFAATAQSTASMSVEAIMERVARNQDRTEAERAHFVYVQHSHVQSRKGSIPMCDEEVEARITPTPAGFQRTVLSLSGHVRDGKRTIHYTTRPDSSSPHMEASKGDDGGGVHVDVGDKETVLDADAHNAPVLVNDTDLDIVESMRRTFTSDKRSKDGIGRGLFPLTTEQQQGMSFELKGRENKNGHDTFHIIFKPREESDYDWKGDAWIDATAFEPVVVRTALSRNIPLGVRMLLGTNVPGLGFTAIYAPQDNGVWFPVSFGSEFKMRVLFMFSRQIVVDVQNRAFERTHVTSTLHAGKSDAAEPEEQHGAPRP